MPYQMTATLAVAPAASSLTSVLATAFVVPGARKKAHYRLSAPRPPAEAEGSTERSGVEESGEAVTKPEAVERHRRYQGLGARQAFVFA